MSVSMRACMLLALASHMRAVRAATNCRHARSPSVSLPSRRASLSEEVQAWAEEVALDEQGHVRMVREVSDERAGC